MEPARFVDAPGRWWSDASDVHVDLDDRESLVVDGVRRTGHHTFANVDDHGALAAFDENIVEVGRRGANFMIRVRNPNNPIRTAYAGTPTYPPSPSWVVPGRFVSFTSPRSVEVGASAEGLTHVFESPGEIEFEIDHRRLRLVAFNDEEPDELFIVFSDLTSGPMTYGACRFLSVEAPGSDCAVSIDFNRATNPPCAYTDFATCPLPPAQNHLPVRIEAGEKLPSTPH